MNMSCESLQVGVFHYHAAGSEEAVYECWPCDDTSPMRDDAAFHYLLNSLAYLFDRSGFRKGLTRSAGEWYNLYA